MLVAAEGLSAGLTHVSDSGTTVERDLRTETRAAGRNSKAGWGRDAKTRHSNCVGQVHPASGYAGVAATVGPDIFRPQLRVPTRTVGSRSEERRVGKEC